MALSTRALNYLAKAEFKKSITDEKEIQAAFERKGIKATSELIRFQKQYGGFTYYVWREPIVFGILHPEKCRGDFRGCENELLIEEDEDTSKKHYTCADTLYQESFTITENGNYYEGCYNLTCLSFETQIESHSMYDFMDKDGQYKNVYSYVEPDASDSTQHFEQIIKAFSDKFKTFHKEFNLTAIDGHWDEIQSWHEFNDFLVSKSNIGIDIFSKKIVTKEQTDIWDNMFKDDDYDSICNKYKNEALLGPFVKDGDRWVPQSEKN